MDRPSGTRGQELSQARPLVFRESRSLAMTNQGGLQDGRGLDAGPDQAVARTAMILEHGDDVRATGGIPGCAGRPARR